MRVSGNAAVDIFAIDRWQGEPVNRLPHEHTEIRRMDGETATRCLIDAHAGFAALIAMALRQDRWW